ncbi:MAG: hypothetical protein IH614_03120 [Desulfuromonadales bacterium]|nr:hypothetical protein [Desulfuromonadales bacterium]
MSVRDEFVPVEAGDWNFLLRPALADASFAKYCGLPAAEYPEGLIPVVSSPNAEVRRFFYQGMGYFLKEYFFLGWKKHLKVLRRGEHLACIASQLAEHGFLTPRVVGIGRSGTKRRVVTEAVEDALDVWQVLFPDFQQHRGDVDDGFVYALGYTIGNLHRCGFFHGDLRWRNVLTRLDQGEWKFYFIDNDRTQRFRLGLPLHRRVKNLSQFLFSGMLVAWPQAEWQVFLQGYFDASQLSPSLQGRLVAKVTATAQKRLEERRQEENR